MKITRDDKAVEEARRRTGVDHDRPGCWIFGFVLLGILIGSFL